MNDHSHMPFGPHKGTKMANVPAVYLLALYKRPNLNPEVKAYIEDNMDVLKMELQRERRKLITMPQEEE